MITKQRYVEYLLCTMDNCTGTHPAVHVDTVSHDVITDHLRSGRHTARGVSIIGFMHLAGIEGSRTVTLPKWLPQNWLHLVQLQVTFSEIKSCFKRSFRQLFPKITPDSELY